MTHSMDVRPGGVWRYTMQHAEYGTFENGVIEGGNQTVDRLVEYLAKR